MSSRRPAHAVLRPPFAARAVVAEAQVLPCAAGIPSSGVRAYDDDFGCEVTFVELRTAPTSAPGRLSAGVASLKTSGAPAQLTASMAGGCGQGGPGDIFAFPRPGRVCRPRGASARREHRRASARSWGDD